MPERVAGWIASNCCPICLRHTTNWDAEVQKDSKTPNVDNHATRAVAGGLTDRRVPVAAGWGQLDLIIATSRSMDAKGRRTQCQPSRWSACRSLIAQLSVDMQGGRTTTQRRRRRPARCVRILFFAVCNKTPRCRCDWRLECRTGVRTGAQSPLAYFLIRGGTDGVNLESFERWFHLARTLSAMSSRHTNETKTPYSKTNTKTSFPKTKNAF